jgi:hypothetical protein
MPYCTAKDVINFTGYEESDFDKVDPGAFEDLVTKWIGHADGMINRNRNRTFDVTGDDAELAPVLEDISMRITANIMAKASQFRTSPVEKIDDFTMRLVPSEILDASIRADLKTLPGVARMGMGIASGHHHHHHNHHHHEGS